jgi:MarR family transcriptional regulator, organic hydroperoxide resistance regulator
LNNIDRNSIYYVFLEILRLHHHKAHKLLEEIGLYPGQPPLLFILNKNGGKSQRELADMMHVKASTMNVMIKRMEKSGFIERRQDKKDARISRVYITDMGRKICKKSYSAMQEIEDQMLSNLTKDELVICRRLLLQVKDNLYGDEE